ncbi:MAG: zinc ribbon domain-containing protein [Clostridia bacterium]|nr:zinc ribbon domain-containing protein [Clostridia bacterium]
MPVVVEREKYLKVKSIMDDPNRYKNKRDAKELYLLSGIIKCGRCGSIMIGNRNDTLAYYICSTRKKARTCDTHNIPKKVVEDVVLSYLEQQFSDNAINNMIRYLEENKINYVSAYNEKIKRLVAEKSAITKKIDNLVNMGLNGSLQDIFNTKLKELKEKYEAAELQIAEIKTVLAKEDDLSNKINGYIKSVSNIRGYDLNRQARIIRSLVRKVEIICNGKGKKDFTVMIESVFGKEEFTENGQKEKPTSDEECGLSLVAPWGIEPQFLP